LVGRGVDFNETPNRAVVVGIDRSKLSPLDYAKEHFQKWPDAKYIMENINTIEQATQI
jgi:hypothetical protein